MTLKHEYSLKAMYVDDGIELSFGMDLRIADNAGFNTYSYSDFG